MNKKCANSFKCLIKVGKAVILNSNRKLAKIVYENKTFIRIICMKYIIFWSLYKVIYIYINGVDL